MQDRKLEKYKLKNCEHRYKYPIMPRPIIMRSIKKKDKSFRNLTDNMMCKIVDRIMELKVQQLFTTGYITLGHGFGSFDMYACHLDYDSIKGYQVDWDKTLELWLDNEQAKEKKILVRNLTKDTVRFTWKDKAIKFNNLKYYSFVPMRKLRVEISKRIKNRQNIVLLHDERTIQINKRYNQ